MPTKDLKYPGRLQAGVPRRRVGKNESFSYSTILSSMKELSHDTLSLRGYQWLKLDGLPGQARTAVAV